VSSIRNHYRVSFAQPHAHLADVEARFDDLDQGVVVLRMAAWTPGSYLVRDYSRHVQDLVAEDPTTRTPLSVTKIDKAGWRVDLAGARDLVVRYRLYSHDLTVRTNHVDGTHAFLNGASTWLWLDERRAEAVEVTVEPPAVAGKPWRVIPAAHFEAADLDALIDTPIHAGNGPYLERQAAGKPLSLTVWGRPREAQVTVDRFADDLVKIVNLQANLFGGVPYDRYDFMLFLVPESHGGLEHRASTALLCSPFAFETRKRYDELLELASHEYFHLWNVKRLRPERLGPFDYTRENYTRSLWFCEGVTSYYDRLFVRRARLMPTKRYLEKLAEEWTTMTSIPGRKKQSVEESSFDAWIKLYRPDENTVNSTVSYYLKGGIVALCLDLEIRRRTGGRRSLDDVMRHLWQTYGARDRGYADADLCAEVGRAVDLDVAPFFARFISGREDPDLAGELRNFGYFLRPKNGRDENGPPAEERPDPWLGVSTRVDGGRLMVASAISGGPAEHAGLYAGDEIVAVDRFRVDERRLTDRIGARRPGDRVQVSVFRRDELHEVDVILGDKPRAWEIVVDPQAADAEKARGLEWLGED
jgi:predicted metalloprotease with PDZ domain